MVFQIVESWRTATVQMLGFLNCFFVEPQNFAAVQNMNYLFAIHSYSSG